MKLVRIMGVILLIGAFVVFSDKYVEESLGVNEVNTFALESNDTEIVDNQVNYGNKVFDMENNKNVEIITYTNNNNYDVTLGASSITINCIGTGSTKEHDELIATRGMKIKAAFAENKSSDKYDKLTVAKHKTAYIYVISTFEGDEYPINEVTCNYSMNVTSM